MDTTIHGWPVIDDMLDSRLWLFTIPGTKRKIRLRRDVGPYLVAFCADYHRMIALIDTGTFDDWGWCAPRPGRASDRPSDHCGGVAVDLNATREGAQRSANLAWFRNPIRWAKWQALVRRYRLLEHGLDYERHLDPMHHTFRHGIGPADVTREMTRVGIGPDGKWIK